MRRSKNDGSYKDRGIRGPIPVTIGTFDTRRKHEEPKFTTVTRMAALRRQKRRHWYMLKFWAGEGGDREAGRMRGPGTYIGTYGV